ncbi:MAG TPA: asparagine synthase (glutamine-hydrolyzing) [Bacteroidales bacterium]|nr:asparagine synthase (glutamine-hydrolyzing) [Bacteroidales bacterium]
MCGIVGIYNNSVRMQDSESLLKRMLERISYRGPDESGIYLNKHVALGSVRLSIIDIKTGQQPLSSADGKYWIVFNGEIFNYIELKAELLKLGYAFRTECDTEVLLNAYLAFGPDCLNRLNGQFVFAIWNNEKEELFLARDRVGIRPLFYTWTNNIFVFGSEIKTILEHPQVNAEIDPVSMSQIFTFWSTLTPNTVFKGIYEVPPGHFMQISGGRTIIKQYWSLSYPVDNDSYFKGTIDEAAEELELLLTDAARIRLRADVQVAAYLSGGLDSSATTALIKKVMPEALQTFSIRFEDDEFDETGYQQEVSQYLGTRHIAFTCTRQDIGTYFPQVIWHSESPILRTAPVPMFCLSRKVRENNIKVVITGEGSDEMLAGYDIFKEAVIRQFWSRQPDSVYRPLLLQKLYPYLAQFKGENKRMLKLFFGYQLQDTGSPFYSHILRWRNTSNMHVYFSDDLKEAAVKSDQIEEVRKLLPNGFDNYDVLNKSQWLEIVTFMSSYLLSSQGDRVAMANSVEGRYPFLDYRLIEFASKLPPDFKMHGLNEKYILKRMMRNRLPESVLKRPKQAYRAPVANSFLSTPVNKYVTHLLSEDEIKHTGLFQHTAVEKLINKISDGHLATEMENMALAGILSSQLLYHQYILKDDYIPTAGNLAECRVIRESNPIYT